MYYGKKIMLRSLELEDAGLAAKLMNNVEVRGFLADMQPMTEVERRDWIEGSWSSRGKDEKYLYAIASFDGEWLGYIYLDMQDKIGRTAEMGLAIADATNRGRGYGTDAIRVILALAFRELKLHRVWLRCGEANVGGIKAYERCGFVHVGKDREAYFRGGKFVDLVRMDVLSHEFLKRFPEYDLKIQVSK